MARDGLRLAVVVRGADPARGRRLRARGEHRPGRGSGTGGGTALARAGVPHPGDRRDPGRHRRVDARPQHDLHLRLAVPAGRWVGARRRRHAADLRHRLDRRDRRHRGAARPAPAGAAARQRRRVRRRGDRPARRPRVGAGRDRRRGALGRHVRRRVGPAAGGTHHRRRRQCRRRERLPAGGVQRGDLLRGDRRGGLADRGGRARAAGADDRVRGRGVRADGVRAAQRVPRGALIGSALGIIDAHLLNGKGKKVQQMQHLERG
ncbi:conserved hypothetical protein [Frigoribacterium sp. 9N]|nr:conserved hypothetical protein [Frigoribacterium sp. 9N]